MSLPLKLSALPALLAIGVLAAGCGSSSSSPSANAQTSGTGTSSSGTSGSSSSGGGAYGAAPSNAASTTPATAAAKTVIITTAHSSKLGTYLVDGAHRTVYLFEKDHRGNGKSACSGACAQTWPPVTTTGQWKAAGGVKAAKLTMIKRSDGTKQLAYNGWPLYRFSLDARGTTKGQGLKAFGAEWYTMSTAGQKIDKGS